MPVTIAIADKVRHFVSGSRRTMTEIAAANRTLVSRNAATSAIGAFVVAQMTIQYAPNNMAPPASPLDQ